MTAHYIGADVDSKMTDLAVQRNGRIIQRYCVPASILCLREVLGQIGGGNTDCRQSVPPHAHSA